MRLGSVIVFVAHVVFALSVSVRAAWDASLSPFKLILSGCGVDAALTNFMHALLRLSGNGNRVEEPISGARQRRINSVIAQA